ncbi:adenylate cyclase [Butyrivibrio sp. XB500-5]|uniref:adenylate cyclase n=1 Tax=Butyrivibrio sp. XB500-5 TaxID=2364880 RepID=UPI000EAA859C|nr:adenylate cyclase [Butyrivibrio sp. XB500-5]RKM56736.1 adenylate cyclase [Butyrivibrio sp. XB500-5]
MAYDFAASRDRIDCILSSKTKIVKKDIIPENDSEFTYSNGIRSWVGAIFVDMVKSREMCDSPDESTARIFRAYCSELIAILKEDTSYRQIGIRGDCVYSINSISNKDNLVDMFYTAVQINTFMKMFNKQLLNYGYKNIRVGIGLGCSDGLIIKAGQSGTGINDKIWIGKAVVEASSLGDLANRNGVEPIAMSTLFYNNVHYSFEKINKNYTTLIKAHKKRPFSYYDYSSVDYYHCNVCLADFDDWIEKYL